MEDQSITQETEDLLRHKSSEFPFQKLYGAPYGLDIRPTQSLLQKWLREEHNIHIEISREYIKGKIIGYDCIIDYEEGIIDLETKSIYEEALEQGLLEALKLIK